MRLSTCLPVCSLLAALSMTAPAHAQGKAKPTATPAAAPPASPFDAPEAAALKGLEWRSIGPANMGGRVTDIEGVPGDPSTYYVAGANGGLWKTTNGGTTFKALFTNQKVYSIGAVAIAPSNPGILYVGTGEGDPRNSASFGDGVYRSNDGGESWTWLGLKDSEKIKRIRIHPTNPDIAYVAVVGHSWGPNEERGVFMTTDGGKTWKKTLYIDKEHGAGDLEMDPANPSVLYATMWRHVRKPWRFDSGGGESSVWKSTDAGLTWRKIMKGLPNLPMDRAGIAASRSNPNIVYLLTEFKDGAGELFRSEDFGENWRKVNDDPNLNFRPFYYSDLRVDPKTPERLYTLSGGLSVSTDGGRTFRRIGGSVHGDHQAFWIDPESPMRLLSGSDGGFQISYDGGNTWDVVNNIVLSQFYHVTFDLQHPYNVCGGLQDNGNWCGPINSLMRDGIRKRNWFTVSGGDGFYTVPDKANPHLVYSDSQGGGISLTNTKTGDNRNIHPYPRRVGSAGDGIAEHKYRFNWNAPIVESSHDPKVIFFGGNVLFRTSNYGQSWDVISPDLTTNDKSKQQSSGGPIVVDNTAAEFHCTIIAISESPLDPNVIWVGTDDGNIQVTQDGGKTWTNVVKNIALLPANTWIQQLEASHYDRGTVHVAIDRHRDDDPAPYVYKSTDFGKTWTKISGNLPAVGWAWAVREDPKVKGLIYVGTETGFYASWDGGNRYASLRNNLPPVAVNDFFIHPRENDLVIGTHGRGAWVIDDISAIQNLATAMNAPSDLTVFDIRRANRWSLASNDTNLGERESTLPNPRSGASIDFYLKAEAKDAPVITIADSGGQLVRTLRGVPKNAGVNRVYWDLRYEGPRQQATAGPPTAAQAESEGFLARFGFGGGAYVVPGEYTVTVKHGTTEVKKTVKVEADPRETATQGDYVAQRDAALKLRDLTSRVNGLLDRLADVQRQLETQREVARRDRADLAPYDKAIDAIKAFRADKLARPLQGLGYRQYPRLREEIQSVSGGITAAASRPTDSQMLRLKELEDETAATLADAAKMLSDLVGPINDALKGRPVISIGGGPRP